MSRANRGPARALTTDITVDRDELAWGGWFSRERLRQEVAAGRLVLPTAASLAHRLVTDWWGDGALPG